MHHLLSGISFKLAKWGVGIALVVGFVATLTQVIFHFAQKIIDVEQEVTHLIQTNSPAAAKSLTMLDSTLADELTTQFIAIDYIERALIINESGLVLAERNSAVSQEFAAWTVYVTENIVKDRFRRFAQRLSHSRTGQELGELVLEIDMNTALQGSYNEALFAMAIGIVRSSLLALFLLLVFHRLLAKPLLRAGREIATINPENPDSKRLSLPQDQRQGQLDEIGHFISSTNTLISAVEGAMEKHRNYEATLEKSERHIRDIIDNLPVWVGARNVEGYYIFANRALAEFFNLKPDSIRGKSVQEFQGFYKADYRKVQEVDRQVIAGSVTERFIEEVYIDIDGVERRMQTHLIPVDFYDERIVLMVSSDVTELKAVQAKMEHMAYHDPLTSLPNRSYLLKRLEEEVRRARSYDFIGALLFIDLDQFKYINDSLGHPAGDVVLKHVAERLTAITKESDVVVRLGGDEFVVVLSNLGDQLPKAILWAEQIAERIRSFVSEPHYYGDMQLHVSCSVGVVMFPDEGEGATVHDLLSFADAAMYQVKDAGRNSVKFFDRNMTDKARKVLVLEDELHKALDRKQFTLNYQPRVNVRDGNIVGGEALIRWYHPERGLVSPADFIPVLEASGFITEVGMWVLEEAVRQLFAWIDNGYWKDGMRLGINISPRQFRAQNFVEKFLTLIQARPEVAHCIELEITEGIIIHNFDETVEKMHLLREHGVHFSIDDFGTGYSSISYLKRLPVSVLKIDQSFIRDLTVDRNDRVLVETISAMGNMLGLEVVAEGVELVEQLKLVREYGCMYYQGFYCSRAMSAEDFGELLTAPIKIAPVTQS